MDFSNQPISEEYKRRAPIVAKSNWFDLADGTNILLRKFPDEITPLGNLVTIKRLKAIFGNNHKLNSKVIGLKPAQNESILKIKFPINLVTKDYVKLFALMLSEGSYNTEFSLNVPEEEFHEIFASSLRSLVSKDVKLRVDKNHGTKRSRAPSVLRYVLPFYEHLPSMLFDNKEFAKEYLRIVFEAEGSPILDSEKSKRYIKLSRNCDVSNFFKENHHIVEGKRLFINELRNKYPSHLKKIIKIPHITLLGEHILLKEHFDINSTLKLESIRLNKIDNRCGKISAKWVLYIYAEDINKFIEKIGFLSRSKQEICRNMKNIPSHKPQYFAFRLMKEIQRRNVFLTKDFMGEMKKLGYKTPQKFLWDYSKNKKIIKWISRGKYKILI